jgi:hypothetical protein
VRKDGSGRERLANGISGIMMPVVLLVDDRHVYAANRQELVRVPLAGGKLESLGPLGSISLSVSIAQDEECVYYATDTAIVCVSKADGHRERVTTTTEGSFRQVAVAGTDVYFGVYIPGPAFDAKSWVGRVVCTSETG